MLSFQEFLKLKQQDMFGTDVRKTEYAACRNIVTVVQENIKFVQNPKIKNELENIVQLLMKKGK